MTLTTLCWSLSKQFTCAYLFQLKSPCEVGFKRWNNSPRFLQSGSAAEQEFESYNLASESILLTTTLIILKLAMEMEKIPWQ